MKKPNGNTSLKKYEDFEIETYFNNENNTGLSAKDMQLKEELNVITNQYMSAFNNINEIANKFNRGDENIIKTNFIKNSLDQLNYQNSNEYGRFLNQLYDATNNTDVTSITYDNYKKDSKNADMRLLRIINDNKYDIFLYLNKNANQVTYNRLKALVDEQKRRNQSYNNYSRSSTQDYGAPPAQSGNNYIYSKSGDIYYNNNNNNNNSNNNNTYYNNRNNYYNNNGGNYGNNNYNYGNYQFQPPHY